MKAAFIVLTTAIAMTALAVPHRGVRDSNRTDTTTTLMPTLVLVPIPTTKLLPPDTTLVPTPSDKLLPPSASAGTVQLDSMNKLFVTLTPVPSPSPNSTATGKNSNSEDKDAKKKIHILGTLWCEQTLMICFGIKARPRWCMEFVEFINVFALMEFRVFSILFQQWLWGGNGVCGLNVRLKLMSGKSIIIAPIAM
ncbi:hypothetical protein Asppvi_007301 [Aspergillus pseudoviridinutans]|uniref:Uncharacterized protein n=1 Tax=Aspergillus pseudoviridinutans TaxID=1517512 RepID=A0A9P3BFI0_9EURO|nr:uncharacterized protein Asppvi_007301 [Aspergillus pseudoviridinutans]GIJ88380.1 hypothetical protein Asppvi_007301 [Aspergillus pseudoviridinutans]